jgi:O-antigen/teichoic acid export membrane protein
VTSATQAAIGLGGLFRRGGLMAVAMMVMNLATYGYTVIAAHTIGKEQFGAFSALMGVLLVVNVLSLGLQATGARRISAHPDQVSSIERLVLSVGVRSALVLGLLCLLLAPVLNVVLRLESLPTAMLVAAAAAPLTVMGAQAGVLQGERRWEPLALLYLAQGLGRVLCGLPLMFIWPTEFAAMLGVALGAWLPVVVGYVALRRPREHKELVGHPGIDLIREVGHSSQALFAFFALSNADILMARALLPDDQAGLYAGGLIMAKAVLFLPQFVVVVAFPSMSRQGASRRTLALALALAALIGVCVLVGTLLLPDLALVFVGGDDFADIADYLWIFVIIGTLLSMIQLLVYSALARRQGRAIILIWTTLVVVVVGATFVTSATSLAYLVAVVDAVLCATLILLALTMKPGTDKAVPVVEVRES